MCLTVSYIGEEGSYLELFFVMSSNLVFRRNHATFFTWSVSEVRWLFKKTRTNKQPGTLMSWLWLHLSTSVPVRSVIISKDITLGNLSAALL